MRDSFRNALYDVIKTVPKVFIVVADISPAASMASFRADFPERFINVGVSEQSMISLCAGLAMRGCRPFAYSIAPFTIYRPFEHIRVELCYQNLPVVLVGVGAGVAYSVLGSTHNAFEDVAVMSALPGMSVIAPCDPEEVRSAVWACMEQSGPVYLRLGKSGEPVLTAHAPDPFQFGKIRCIKNGSDICILGYGPILTMALEAAHRHESAHGGSVAIYSAHTLKPLDIAGIGTLLSRFRHIVVLEEHSAARTLAGQVKEAAWDVQSGAKISTCSLKDRFIHVYGSKDDLLRAHGISVDAILALMSDRSSSSTSENEEKKWEK
ncbi:MAG: Transketolase [Magnetococcales bacterium]|nr:Transketolase [Magnetococcales bacterium]HIJ83319.1 transketolase [Magnetococcales bacterium]